MKVELRGITKRFPGVLANDSIDLTVNPGEVHALLGENGAGKTTLMSILYGLYAPDSGEIRVDGEPVTFETPRDAIRAGIGMVHQHFMLIPAFTAAENVILGRESVRRGGFLDRRAARVRVERLSAEYGLAIQPDARVEDLPVGVQQRIEILKALYREAACLILDEPTAVLTPGEIEELFRVMRTLVEGGRSIIFISHKLREIMAIADRVTVLRRGSVVATTTPAESSERELASMMVGRSVGHAERTASTPGEPVLEIHDLVVLDDRLQPAVAGVDLDVRRGEIVAVAGVEGNGQTELVEALTGLRKPVSGHVVLDGEDITGHSPRDVFRAGVAHVPEDRLRNGLVPSFPVRDNLVLNNYFDPSLSRGIVVRRAEVEARAERLVDEFDVRTPSTGSLVSTLSGGNQQKVIVAREFSHPSKLLIAAQPTRGLDVGSIEYIHSLILKRRADGDAVLIVSTELDEIMVLADRIAVLFRGRVVGLLDRDRTTREEVGFLMAGLTNDDRRERDGASR